MLVGEKERQRFERATEVLGTVQISGYEKVDNSLTWLTLEYEYAGSLIRLGRMVCLEEIKEQMELEYEGTDNNV